MPTQSLVEYLKLEGVSCEVNQRIILLNSVPFSIYFIDKNDEITVEELLALRQKHQTEFNKLLIFIWWDLWELKPKIIKSKLFHLLGKSQKIHARKTSIKYVEKSTAIDFQLNTHLMIPLTAYKRIGLYLDDELIALGVFAKKRKFRDGTYSAELLRFCTKNNYHINGGLSKLIKTFSVQHSIDSLMTYVDLDWSNGSKFERIGFKTVEKQPPLYFKLKNNKRVLSTSSNYDIFNVGSLKLILTLESN